MIPSLPSVSFASSPTPAHLALAILVLKSKPIESSLEDHLAKLQRCVKSGSRDSSKHLDSFAFWKQAYQELEVAHSGLLSKHHELDQEIEQLRNDLRLSKGPGVHAGVKRKRSLDPVAKQGSNRKRNSVSAVEMEAQEAGDILDGANCTLESREGIGGPSAIFARNFFVLRQQLSARTTNRDALAATIRMTCTALDDTLSRSIESFPGGRANTAKAQEKSQGLLGELARLSSVFRRCYPSLLRAIEKLSAEDYHEQNGVYDVVRLFQNVIGHLHAIAAIKTATTSKENKSARRNKPGIKKQSISAPLHLDQICMLLTKLATQFLEGLDLLTLSHNKVWEGLTCVFLDHLGSSLSLVVFANASENDPKGFGLGILPPRGLLDTSDIDQQRAVRTTQHEACYLVTILRHLVIYIDQQQSFTGSESAPLLKAPNSFTTSNSTFASRIRDKLQDTLLRGVFGDDDVAFKDALRRPVDDDRDVASTSPEVSGEWLIEEVWKLLGWNILTSQNDTALGLAQTSDDLI